MRSLPPGHEQIGGDADHGGQKRAGRSGEPHRGKGVGKGFGGQVGDRDPNQYDRNDILHEGDFGTFAGAEITAEAEMDPGENTV